MALRTKPGKPGGTSASATITVANVNDDARLRKLEGELTNAEQRFTAAQAALDEKRTTLSQLEAALDKAQLRHLAGRVTDKDVAEAQSALDAAKKQHAIALAKFEDADRQVTILPQAIAEAKNAALGELRDRLRSETDAKLRRLMEVMQEAKTLSDDIARLHDVAVNNFHIEDLLKIPGGQGLYVCRDLGEAGFIQECAGIPVLSIPWLTPSGRLSPDGRSPDALHDVWLIEAKQYLAKTPEQRRQEDIERRESIIKLAKERRVKALADEVAYEKLLKTLGQQRFMTGMPHNTELLD
jgi:hypothetical protein